jgi:DNA (cytosine-5)-methyltransferase 1
MRRKLTLGSLFDGSGGFPLGAILSGIEPLWASEVEPFPIRVTTRRLPQVQHLGDINKIHGATVPPVDIVTGGFCCQDLSVAGKRIGLHGERSGLFFQIIRIIKEMKNATGDEYPKFAILENVPGMYSSNRGRDFLEVINELIRVKDETLSAPMPEKGKWSTSGEIVGGCFSLAWRTLDAQFWGVAQRRRRCYLVVDFTGQSAGKILFDETRLCGNPPASIFTRETTAGDITHGAGITVPVLNDQGGRCMDVSENITGTLRSREHGHQPIVVQSAGFCTEHSEKSRSIGYEEEKSPTLRAGVVPGTVTKGNEPTRGGLTAAGGCFPAVADERNPDDCPSKTVNDQALFAPKVYGICSQNSNSMKSCNPNSGICEMVISRTLDTGACSGNGGQVVVFDGKQITSKDNRSNPQPGNSCHTLLSDSADTSIICVEGNGARPSHKGSGVSQNGISFSLNTVERHAVSYGIDRAAFNQGKNAQYKPQITEESVTTLTSRGPSAVYSSYIVRRLIPTECALLQGFPSGWCEDLEISNPAEDDIAFWTDIWETHRLIMGKSKRPRSRNQIIKWLRSPHSDSAEYKMWGNGVALPCVVFVLGGIAYYMS